VEMIRNIYTQLFGYSKGEWRIGGALAAIGGVIGGMLGGFDGLLRALLIAMVFDVFTGVYLKKILKQISSSKGINGISKKIGILMMIMFAFVIDGVLGQTGVLRNGAVIFYLAMEGLSLIENLTAMGVPAFQPLKEYLAQLQEDGKKSEPTIIKTVNQATTETIDGVTTESVKETVTATTSKEE